MYLDYYLDVVASEFEDTIWVTFSEPIRPENPTPQISIDYLDDPEQAEDISLQSLIMDSQMIVFNHQQIFILME